MSASDCIVKKFINRTVPEDILVRLTTVKVEIIVWY